MHVTFALGGVIGHDVAYVFAADRSGETPKRILGGTKSTLIIDAYSGYNIVADVSRRRRAAATRI